MRMRSEPEIRKQIMDLARRDERIRAVILNGSRANPDIEPDKYQDYDIVFYVTAYKEFVDEEVWTSAWGKILICQKPDEMTLCGQQKTAVTGFHHLMIFEDGNRIDLTVLPVESLADGSPRESATIVWMDKDNLLNDCPLPDGSDYYIRRPDEKEFLDTCNEFRWVSTYAVKGLLREEVIYAKEITETVLRPMFMRMLEWKIGAENNFHVSFGKAGRFMRKYVTEEFYENILATYSNAGINDNWRSLIIMSELFTEISNEVAAKLNFSVNKEEETNTAVYHRRVYSERCSGNE